MNGPKLQILRRPNDASSSRWSKHSDTVWWNVTNRILATISSRENSQGFRCMRKAVDGIVLNESTSYWGSVPSEEPWDG